jgi:hypothetical protein
MIGLLIHAIGSPIARPAADSTTTCRNTSHNTRSLRAKRETDADLAGPSRDRVGRHAVEADAGEQERSRRTR